MLRAGEFLPGLDQAFMDRVELVGALRDDVAFDRLFEPGPLKHRRLEDRGRGVRVVFQQFRRTAAVEAEIQPAIEAGVVAVPALGNQRPEGFRYLQPAQIFFVVDGAADQFEAHRVDFAGRLLDLAFDLLQRERVIGPFVPIAFAVDGVKIESGALGGRAPVIAFGADDTLHEVASRRHARHDHGRRDHVQRHVRAVQAGAPRRRSRDRSGRSRAFRPGRGRAHCRGRNPTGAPGPSIPRRPQHFPSMSAPHDANVSWLRSCSVDVSLGDVSFHHSARSGSKRKPVPFTASCRNDQPPEKPTAWPNEPKPPRCDRLEPESEVLEDEARRGPLRVVAAARRSAAGAAMAAGRRTARRAFGVALQQRRRGYIRRPLAIVARHQRIGGAADRKRAHQQQRDMARAFRRRAWPRPAGTEAGLRLPKSLSGLLAMVSRSCRRR